MLEHLIKPKHMISISSRNMAPRDPNLNIMTIIAKAIPDQVVVVVEVRTVVLFINQTSVQDTEKNVTGAT